MKKYVYNLFTTENGIRMNIETLNYITNQYKSEEEIKMLFSLFRSKYNTQTIEISDIKSLGSLQKEEKKRFIIKNCVYNKPNILFEKYDLIKTNIEEEITPISTLDDNKNVIYGIYYKDKYGMDTLEDSHGSILLNFKYCLSNSFLYENIFVAIEGKLKNNFTSDKIGNINGNDNINGNRNDNRNEIGNGNDNINGNRNDIGNGKENDNINDNRNEIENININGNENRKINLFICEKIIYPKIKLFQKINSFLEECPLKILVFSCYTIESKEFVDKTILEIKPDLVILSIHETSKVYKHKSVKTIIYRCGCISKRMPNKIKDDEASNPFSIETYNRRITFISHDIVKYRKNGVFLNKNPLESFLRAFISQRSYNPFYKGDLSYEEIPNIIIIAQKFYPFIMEIEGVKVASIMPVENKSYLLLDLFDDNIKMVCENI